MNGVPPAHGNSAPGNSAPGNSAAGIPARDGGEVPYFFLPAVALLGVAGASFSALSVRDYGVAVGSRSVPGGHGAAGSFCDSTGVFNCSAVALSDYSTLFGLPLGVYGFVYYVMIVYSAAACLVRPGARRSLPDLLLPPAIASAAVSVALFAVSARVVGALCLWCVCLYLTSFLLALVTWFPGRGTPFFSRLAASTSALVKAPLSVLGPSGTPAVAFFVGLAAAAAVAVWLPEGLGRTGPRPDEAAGPGVDAFVREWRRSAEISDDALAPAPGLAGFVRGPAGAPVTIVEFSDFECPSCRSAFPVLERFVSDRADSVRFVFRHYPLDHRCNPEVTGPLHLSACDAAEVAACAAEQGREWDAVRALFTAPVFDGRPRAEVTSAMRAAVVAAGVDGEKLASCLASDRPAARVAADVAAGNDVGVPGTPSVWLNGKLVRPLRPDVLDAIHREVTGPGGR